MAVLHYKHTACSTKSTSFAATVQLDSNSEASDTEERSTFEEQAVQIDPADEEQMNQFMSSDPMKRRTLADIIQEKLTEKRTEIQSQMSGKYMCGLSSAVYKQDIVKVQIEFR